MNLRFDQPLFLYLALLALPLIIIGWRTLSAMDPFRRVVVLLLRTVLVLIISLALAQPRTVQEHDDLTVIGLLDVSGSVLRFADLTDDGAKTNIAYLRRWFREATGTREPDDRFGLIVFDGRAIAISAPTKGDYADDNLDVRLAEGTNIGEAIRLGLAMFPADTAKRIVLVSDGNQTSGSAAEAARQAAGGSLVGGGEHLEQVGIPIDIVAVTYQLTGDVQVVRVESPSAAQPNQTVNVRVVLQSTAPTTGRLTLLHEGAPVDLNGAAPGSSTALSLPKGQTVFLHPVTLGERPVNRFEAIFEPDVIAADAFPDNNSAESFTATPSRGRILVVDGDADINQNFLAETLRNDGMPVDLIPPDMMPQDPLTLYGYDLIILDNVAARSLNSLMHDRIAQFVDSMGGGLIMVGGENGFGAGGWKGTPAAGILPVDLDPPQELRLPTTALVLVLDKSGSMMVDVAGARATQQVVANEGAAMAIESLRSESLVGVVTFDSFADEHVPLQRNTDPQRIAERIRGINSGGGTNINRGLLLAHEMLTSEVADGVQKKHVVCLSDGQSQQSDVLEQTVLNMVADGIHVSTIAVGDTADYELLKRLATVGDGVFYAVRNPKMLPQYLVESVQIVNRPLIKEVPFIPQVLPTGSTLTAGMQNAPELRGIVITGDRPEPHITMEMRHPEGEPLLAHWQVGFGHVAAFTSDANGDWSRNWVGQRLYATFWKQLVERMSRAPMSRDAELLVTLKDDRLHIRYEATNAEGEFLDYLTVNGVVWSQGRPIDVRLLQIGPGLYETSIPAQDAGNYIVALSPMKGDQPMAPIIGGTSRSTSPEFRRYTADTALLEEIRELTRGRVLDINLPMQADLFDRTGMPTSESSLPAWRTVLWWAIALLLLDIASRRIAWNFDMIRSFVLRAVARMAPRSHRGQKAAATLASLRTVSRQVDRRLGTEDAATAPPARRVRPIPVDKSKSRKSGDGSERKQVAEALDTLLDRSGKVRKKKAPKDELPPDEPADRAETTRGLLAAKRRIRRQMEGDSSDEAGGA